MSRQVPIPDASSAASSRMDSTGLLLLNAPDLRVSYVNGEMLTLLGVSREQVLGRTWLEIEGLGLSSHGAEILKVLSGESLLHNPGMSESAGGSAEAAPDGEKAVEVETHSLPGAAGLPQQILVLARDVSSRKRFESDLNRRVYERGVANDFSKALQRTVDLDEVLYVTLAGVTAEQGLQLNRAFLFLYNARSGMLEGAAALGPTDAVEAGVVWSNLSQLPWTLADILSSYDSNRSPSRSRLSERIRGLHSPFPRSSSILVRSLVERRALNVEHGRVDDGLPVEPDIIECLQSDTFAVIPLYTRANNIGVLVVDNWINRNPIRPTLLKLLEIFASHASSAIANSQLYIDLREKVHALEISRAALEENQQQLVRAERLSTVGRMAATVAHEIGNPLVSIGGFARLLRQQIPEDDPRREDIDIILSEVKRLEKIITNILQYSRAQQAMMLPTDLHDVLRKTLDRLGLEVQERKIQVKTELDPAVPEIFGDPDQLMQVFYNLLLNAIHALENGGTITVATALEGDDVWVRIRDTGCGIPGPILKRIFTPFFSTKQSGAGLGLTVVSEIVDAHGGSLAVTSEEGRGTEFAIRLPLRRQGDGEAPHSHTDS